MRQLIAATGESDYTAIANTFSAWVPLEGPDDDSPDYWRPFKPWAIERHRD